MISPREYNCASSDNEIYGEMDNIDFIYILKECPYTIFKMIDVGSGCGKGLIYLCNSEIGNDLEYVCGIECNEYRYNKSKSLLYKQNSELLHKLEFICDDFNHISFATFDLVYCCNIMFDTDLNNKLIDKLLRENIRIFILYTIEPRCSHLFWKRIFVKTSWLSSVPVYIYCRDY